MVALNLYANSFVTSLLGKWKMDIVKGLRLLAASLMMLTGIIHLVLIAFTTGVEMGLMALFGLLYVIIGFGLFIGRRLFSYLGVVIPLVGACLGAYSYVAMKPEPILLPLIVIDIIVILCCCYLILHKTSS
jgi:hypothetical protein